MLFHPEPFKLSMKIEQKLKNLISDIVEISDAMVQNTSPDTDLGD